MQRSDAKELERRVDEVLFYIWDPLGFKYEPFARNEYRSYVSEVLDYLENERSAEELAELLSNIVNTRMGIEFNSKIALTVGAMLVRHKSAIESNID